MTSLSIAPGVPLSGRWWLPGNESEKVSGRLGVDDGRWLLTLDDWIGDWTPGWDLRDALKSFPTIQGEVAHHEVSLSEVIVSGISQRILDRPHEVRCRAGDVLVGSHIETPQTYSAAVLQISHLEAWTNRNAFYETYPDWQLFYKDPGVIELEIDGACSLSIRRRMNTTKVEDGILATSREAITFEFGQPTDLTSIQVDFVRPMVQFIQFALAAGDVVLSSLELRRSDRSTLDPDSWLKLMIAPENGAPKSRKPSAHEACFCLDGIDVDGVLNSWWKVQRANSLPISILLGTSSSEYVDNQILNLAAALEGYHRIGTGPDRQGNEHKERVRRILRMVESPEDRKWLRGQLAFSHQPTFAERLTELTTRAGPEFGEGVGDLSAWIQWLKNLRNSVAHRDPKMADIDRDLLLTHSMARTAEMLLWILLMQDIGVPADRISRALESVPRFRSAVENLKSAQPAWYPAGQAKESS